MDYEECTREEAIDIIERKKEMNFVKWRLKFGMPGNPHAKKTWNIAFQNHEKTKYILNCECTQFPIGKTGKTLDRE